MGSPQAESPAPKSPKQRPTIDFQARDMSAGCHNKATGKPPKRPDGCGRLPNEADRRYRKGVKLTGDTRAALARSAAPFGEARPLPRQAYSEEAFFELDLSLLAGSWVALAHESELDRPGQYVAADVAGERVVVARGADLDVYAFLDQCVHRGTQLTEGERGFTRDLSLVCPYHGLSYDLTGRAIGRCAELGIAPGARLPKVRIARWRGFLFGCLSAETPTLHEWMGAVPPWLERAALESLVRGRRRVDEARANWKLLVENFQESHHFPQVHPSLEAATPWARSTSVTIGDRWLGGTMELASGVETVAEDGRIAGRPCVAAPRDRAKVHDALLLPAWLTSLQPDYFLSYRLVPKAVDRTLVISEIYFHREARATEEEPRSVYTFWDRTNAEDRAICERQQRGISSPSFSQGVFAPTEDGQHAFDQRMAAFYLRAGET